MAILIVAILSQLHLLTTGVCCYGKCVIVKSYELACRIVQNGVQFIISVIQLSPFKIYV